MIGTKVLNYKIERILGKGGMGTVYLGVHEKLGRKVAIKSLHAHLAENEELRKRFKNEAEAMSKLQHQNIVTLYDYEENENGLFLIMEYVEGDELDQYILTKMGPIPTELATDIFGKLLDGFSYAHTNGIVHRDIKPSNIIITKKNEVKILDFGIAKILEGDKSLTKTGTQMGSVLYMSPEQVLGKSVDQRSDIYSLGLTLFQMVTGQCQYDKTSTEFDIYNKIAKEPLPRIASIYPGVNLAFQALIDKATQKDPDNRYASCAIFKTALAKMEEEDDGATSFEGNPLPIITIEKPKNTEGNGETIISKPEEKPKKKNIGILILIISILACVVLAIVISNLKPSEEVDEEIDTEIIVEPLETTDPINDSVITDSKPRKISDLNSRDLSYSLRKTGDIYKSESFGLVLNPSSNLEEQFEFSLTCNACASLYNSSGNNYSGEISRSGIFNVEVYIKDTNTGEQKYLGSKSFESQNRIANSDPVTTMKLWLNNISQGYNYQTRLDYSTYINGYGTTDNTVIYSVNVIFNNGTNADVLVRYDSYDSQNRNLELSQTFHLTNYGTDGWKWDYVTNESVNEL